MLVGRDVLAVHHQFRIAVARRAAVRVLEIAQHLIVGAVLLDDVEHVLDRAGAADLVGNATVSLATASVCSISGVYGEFFVICCRIAASAAASGRATNAIEPSKRLPG